VGLWVAVVLVWSVCIGAAGAEQKKGQTEVERRLQKRISVDFENTPIDDVIRIMAKQADVDIVKSPKVTGTVTARLSDTAVGEVMRQILEARGCSYVTGTHVVTVATLDEIAEISGCVGAAGAEPRLQKRITVDFRDTPIDDVIRIMAKQADLDIVKSPKVVGTVTATLTDVPLAEALRHILMAHGYGYVMDKDVVRVAPLREIVATSGGGGEAGRETLLVIEPTAEQPRNSEGDIVQLKDGRLCLVYTRFTGGTRDHSTADLAMRTSSDNGKTWGGDRILVGKEGKCNVMSVSIVRLRNGELLLFYLRKDEKRRSCNSYVRRSADEFETLSEPVRVTTLEGYHVVNNDRVVQLSTGRLIVPAALHTGFDETGTLVTEFTGKGIPMVYYSDDSGRTWRRADVPVTPVSRRKLTLQEPGVVELKDGRLWMFMRTTHGSQYGCYSRDGGVSWSQPEPTGLVSPCSPATIERVPWTGDLVCVWNDHSGTHPFAEGRRTPLCIAVSKDDGQTWRKSRVIEADPNGWFCYTSMSFVDYRMILSYCAGDKQVGGLNRLKVSGFAKGWLYPASPPKRRAN
jgi:NCAIR mutase (PurE)-related protein